VPEPQQRRHGKDCDKRDDRQIHPTNRGRSGLGQPESRSPSHPRTQTGLLPCPGTVRSTTSVAPLCPLSDHFAALRVSLQSGGRPWRAPSTSQPIRHGAAQKSVPLAPDHERRSGRFCQ